MNTDRIAAAAGELNSMVLDLAYGATIDVDTTLTGWKLATRTLGGAIARQLGQDTALTLAHHLLTAF